jgi:hypothetical protein
LRVGFRRLFIRTMELKFGSFSRTAEKERERGRLTRSTRGSADHYTYDTDDVRQGDTDGDERQRRDSDISRCAISHQTLVYVGAVFCNKYIYTILARVTASFIVDRPRRRIHTEACQKRAIVGCWLCCTVLQYLTKLPQERGPHIEAN